MELSLGPIAFGNPLAFFLLLLGLPILGWYHRALPIPKRRTSTDFLWQRVSDAYPKQAEQLAKRLGLSRKIWVLVLVVVTLAASDPVLPGTVSAAVLVDNSASMQYGDAGAPIKFAKDYLLDQIDGMRKCDDIAIFVTNSPDLGENIQMILPPTSDRALARSTVEALALAPPKASGNFQVTSAAKPVDVLASADYLVLATDNKSSASAFDNAPFEFDEVLEFSTKNSRGNFRIDRVGVRRKSETDDESEIFIAVQAAPPKLGDSTQNKQVTVQLLVNGKEAAKKKVTFGAGAESTLTFFQGLPADAKLTVKLVQQNADAFPPDDQLTLVAAAKKFVTVSQSVGTDGTPSQAKKIDLDGQLPDAGDLYPITLPVLPVLGILVLCLLFIEWRWWNQLRTE